MLTLVGVPATSAAQEIIASTSLSALAALAPLPSASAQNGGPLTSFSAEDKPPNAVLQQVTPRSPYTGPADKRGALVPLYVSFAALQALDVHSTLTGLRSGATEQNPFMRGIVDRRAALIVMKSGVAVSAILLTDRLRRRSRTAAIVLMAAVDSVYATVVAHNYATVHALR